MATPEVAPPEDARAWEARNAPRAGVVAIVSAVLLLLGVAVLPSLTSKTPRVLVTDGLRDALGQPLPGGPTAQGLLTPQLQYLDDHVAGVVIQGLVAALGTALIAVVLGTLFRATAARRKELPEFAIYIALVGPILAAVGQIVFQTSLVIDGHSYVTGSTFTTVAAHDVRAGSVESAGGIFASIGQLVTALAIVLIALNAMRAGLLTRFMGILGMLVAALTIIAGPSGLIVEAFWIGAVGVLLLGRWPSGQPPAWAAGEAIPWPSQQELREQRDALREGREPATRTKVDAEPVAPATVDAPATTSVAAKKRKRKRR